METIFLVEAISISGNHFFQWKPFLRTPLLISSKNSQKFLVPSINLLSKSKMGLEEHDFGRATPDGCLRHLSSRVLKQSHSHYDYIR